MVELILDCFGKDDGKNPVSSYTYVFQDLKKSWGAGTPMTLTSGFSPIVTDMVTENVYNIKIQIKFYSTKMTLKYKKFKSVAAPYVGKTI